MLFVPWGEMARPTGLNKSRKNKDFNCPNAQKSGVEINNDFSGLSKDNLPFSDSALIDPNLVATKFKEADLMTLPLWQGFTSFFLPSQISRSQSTFRPAKHCRKSWTIFPLRLAF